MSQFLNSTTQRLNVRFNESRAEVEEAVDSFESALEASIAIFGVDNVARKWTGEKFESRWNRALLDVLLYYFSDPEVMRDALRHKDKVKEAYVQLFEGGTRFREAVESTTKSLSATHDRFALWGDALADVVSAPVEVPKWNDQKNRLMVSNS